MLPTKLAFVDIETTGMRSFYDRIIEIAIIRVEGNKITRTFHSLINPQSHIPPEITFLTGITAGDLENAPTFRQIKDDILETLSDCVFVAHNVRFDYGFLKNEFQRLDLSFSSKHFCTVRLSRALYPKFSRHNLDSLIERFGFTSEARHRALSDAKILFLFYNKIMQDFPPDQIEKAVNKALKKPSIPLKLQTDLDTLPEGPGVYIFYGKSENQNPKKSALDTLDTSDTHDTFPLYVGKSKNLRERILSHFAADLRSPIEMKISQQVVNIQTISTVGELGALFLESQMIKKMLPLYNKKSRRKRELIALRKVTNAEGYDIVKMELFHPSQKNLPNKSPLLLGEGQGEVYYNENCYNLDCILGIFKSKKKAKDFLIKIAKEYNLCDKLLGLESTSLGTKSGCFASRLGRCKGACTGIEKPIKYNLKYITAFSSSKIKPWPFPGTVVIEESDGTKKEYFLADKWCYIGSIKVDSEGNNNTSLHENYTFDLDIYNILKQFLSNSQNFQKISFLEPNSTKFSENL